MINKYERENKKMKKKRTLIGFEYSQEVKDTMKSFYNSLSEKDGRRYAAVEAIKFGYGGKKHICKILECDPSTLNKGIDELLLDSTLSNERERMSGGGKKKIIDSIENIDEIFFEIIKDHIAGDPMNESIRWTNLNMKEISEAFIERGYYVYEHTVKQLLIKHKFVKRKMQKTKTMKETNNRNEQFEKINDLREEYEKSGNPIISIDVKKKNK
jgi:hypothetical protein